jgi:hypothetical protein
MFNGKEHIRIINFDTIIILLIVFFALLIHNSVLNNSAKRNNDPIRTYALERQSSAVFSAGVKVQIFHKIWILNKDNFNLLAFNSNLLSEDKKTVIRISNLKNIRQSTERFHSFIFRYYLFPSENNEPPLLS